MIELPSQIVGLDNVAPHPNILVFAKAGVGKTTFAASDDNVLFLNCESEGTLSAKRAKSTGKNVRQWNTPNWPEFVKATDWIKDQFRLGKPFPFTWVVVDTISTLQRRILMRWILDQVVARKPTRDPDIPDKPEYLKSQLMIQRCVKELNDLPVNMLYTAHVMQQMDPDGNEFLYPSIQGLKYEIAEAVLAMMTSYGYMFPQTRMKDRKPVLDPNTKQPLTDRIIMWDNYKQMQGKDRTGVLNGFTKNLTLRELRERMQKADAAAESEQK